MKFEEFKQMKNLRQIEPDEIVFDVDDRQLGFMIINLIGLRLEKDNYNFQIDYADGQKAPHLHLKNILGLQNLNYDELTEYKKLFLKKYAGDKADFSLCSKHLVAEENKPHFKYHTIKKLWVEINPNGINFADEEILKQVKKIPERRINVVSSGITAQITAKLSIINLARRRYGLDVNSHGVALCPLHDDNLTKSLKFYDNQGRFYCFGCRVGGNIIEFIKLMEEIKDGANQKD